MLKLLKTLFEPRDALPPHVHVHVDEAGHKVLCDESMCRPTQGSSVITALLGPVR